MKYSKDIILFIIFGKLALQTAHYSSQFALKPAIVNGPT